VFGWFFSCAEVNDAVWHQQHAQEEFLSMLATHFLAPSGANFSFSRIAILGFFLSAFLSLAHALGRSGNWHKLSADYLDRDCGRERGTFHREYCRGMRRR
jgi:hypothetical protein